MKPFCFYAFDLLWLDGRDLRNRTLLERKRLLRKLLPKRPKSVLYVDSRTEVSSTELFRAICDRRWTFEAQVRNELKA